MAQVFEFDFGSDAKKLNYDVFLKLSDDDEFVRVGQCTSDSILNTYEGEDTVDLNISGEVNIASRGTIAFDIAHITTTNINTLKSHDKKNFDVCLKSVEPVEWDDTTPLHRYMTVRDVLFNYQHNFSGGEVNTLPVSFTKVVGTPDAWDEITNEPPEDHPDYIS